MLIEAKLAMQVSGSKYEAEIASLLMAGASDLEIAGVILPGTVDFTFENVVGEDGEEQIEVTDNSTLTDQICMRALITYAQANANWQAEAKAARFTESYEAQKGKLMHATGYTDYGEGDDE